MVSFKDRAGQKLGEEMSDDSSRGVVGSGQVKHS